MKIFILEDDRNRIHEFIKALSGHSLTICEDIITAKADYQPGRYDLILLDHDLGGQIMVESTNENTGYMFAGWMAVREDEDKAENFDYPEVIVHSLNPVGAQNIIDFLDGEGWTTYRLPFGANLLNVLRSLPKAGKP